MFIYNIFVIFVNKITITINESNTQRNARTQNVKQAKFEHDRSVVWADAVSRAKFFITISVVFPSKMRLRKCTHCAYLHALPPAHKNTVR